MAEALVGGVAVGQFGLHPADDCGVAVGPLAHRDRGQLAQLRAGAIGGEYQGGWYLCAFERLQAIGLALPVQSLH